MTGAEEVTGAGRLGAGAAIAGALSFAVFAATEAILGPAQDLANGGAGSAGRVSLSISLLVWALVGFTIALRGLALTLARPSDRAWLPLALAIAAALFASSGLMLALGWVIGWQPEVLLGVVNLPGLVLLVAAWVVVGLRARRTWGTSWRGLLVTIRLGLLLLLFGLAPVGGPIVLGVEALFVIGWGAMGWWLWSGGAAAARSSRSRP